MELLMRDVSITDAKVLLAWRNELDVQKVSRRHEHLSSQEHSEWLTNRLKLLPDQPFWIFESKAIKVGIVRFDFDFALKHFEISITVNSELRGKGFGKIILPLAIENCLARHPSTDFYAEAHQDNIASRLLFLKCGFEEIEPRDNYLVFKRIANSN